MTKNMKFIIAGALSVTALGGAAIAAETLIVKGPMRADTNGDGIVSRAEFFAAAETRFKTRDANADRKLSGDELTDKRGRFARQDVKNDGALSFAEAAVTTSARFGRLDRDADGKLTAEEMRPGRGRGRHHGPGMMQDPQGARPALGAGLLSRLDTNGDGRIIRDEMRAQADQRFDRIDANRDGAIDQAELRAMRGQMGRRGMRNQGMDGMPPPPPAAAPAGDDDQ